MFWASHLERFIYFGAVEEPLAPGDGVERSGALSPVCPRQLGEPLGVKQSTEHGEVNKGDGCRWSGGS